MSEPLEILVQALSKLQDVTGRCSDFMFPRIIAIGNQSAGKSSILEGIVGRPFLPRGSDIVTRCPLYVRLHQTKEGEEERAVFKKEEKFGLEESHFDDFLKVRSEIERRTEKRVGTTKNISHDAIHLDIYSPKYPDLQFVDLPGFTKTNVRGQDENIEQQVLDLNMPFMKDENTIILAIQDATQDIGISEALKHALSKDVDPHGLRTIGVLTKIDNLNSSSDKMRVVEILENKTKPLKLGYVGVVNRSQDEIDRNVDIERSKDNEQKVIESPDFSKIRTKLGIDYLRRFITMILAAKMKKMMPSLKQESLEELQSIKEQLVENGHASNDNVDYDDLIAQLVEKTIDKIRINLHGLDTKVNTETIGTGANMNEKIKKGAVKASKEARQTHSVEEFHRILKTGIRNTHAIRDNVFPEEIVLEIGVSLLTENYRKPFKELLDDSTEFLKNDVSGTLEHALKPYPKFHDLVTDILLGEIDTNKLKAEEYLDMQVDIHKRFINSEHVEFKKLNKVMKTDGIRFKNNFNLWFRENIPTADDNHEDPDNDLEDADSGVAEDATLEALEVIAPLAPAVSGIGSGLVNAGIRKVRGFVERLQKKDSAQDVHTNKLPSRGEEEAMLHMDLCIDYMEIIDKALVDELPKIYIMMLVHKSLDFLGGGDCYRTSLLREVQKKCRDPEMKADVLVKSHAHEEMIRDLKERKRICEETIKVISETSDQLNKCT
eukprot:GFUD01029268.1.p1 GENE.GFUD01029268.1~~GFUD01029268.1.p1  ORF type:complete len:718 (-),score=188.67 GFUD01029268.1:332-2485(-)